METYKVAEEGLFGQLRRTYPARGGGYREEVYRMRILDVMLALTIY